MQIECSRCVGIYYVLGNSVGLDNAGKKNGVMIGRKTKNRLSLALEPLMLHKYIFSKGINRVRFQFKIAEWWTKGMTRIAMEKKRVPQNKPCHI